MPKARPPFEMERYTSLKAQGMSQRAIAQAMGMPEATLRNNLKVLAQTVAQGEGIPKGDHGRPDQVPSPGAQEGPPREDQGTPPLYVHPGIPDDGEESPVGGEDIPEVHQGIPVLPRTGGHEEHQGPPGPGLGTVLAEALTAAWPELQAMLAWWRQRQTPAAHGALVRHTFHVDERWLEAIRREADLTGESYAAVVNRALAQYFTKST